MKLSELRKTLIALYEAKVPGLVSSMPGLGKSDTIEQVTEELAKKYGEEFGLIEVRGSTADPAEVADIPFIIDGSVKKASQAWFPTDEMVENEECPARGIIKCEELADAALIVQSAMQGMIQDRRLGSKNLAEGWYCLGLTNRQQDRAAAGRLSTALANRFIHLNVEADLDEFVSFAYANKFDPIIPAFLRFRPDLLSQMETSKSSLAFPTPRTWHILSRVLNVNPPETSIYSLIVGAVGEGAGSEFASFRKTYHALPDLREIRKNPGTCKIPEEPSIIYATIGALVYDITPKKFEGLVKFFNRLSPEFGTVAVKDCLRVNKKGISQTRGFSEWASRNSEYIM